MKIEKYKLKIEKLKDGTLKIYLQNEYGDSLAISEGNTREEAVGNLKFLLYRGMKHSERVYIAKLKFLSQVK